LLVDASDTSRAWQVGQSAARSGRLNACGSWHDSHATPLPCAEVSDDAIFPWQLVQREATMPSLAVCGSWQSTHAVRPPCESAIPAWHPRQDAAASAGACRAWQPVQTACSETFAAASVGLRPWHAMHASSPPATNSCARWHPVHLS
jgi:hypothetical protein